MQKHDWSEIKQQINQAQKILLSTHINPDGDGLGSEAALYYLLGKLGKQVQILNQSELPAEYQFLNRDGIFHTVPVDQAVDQYADYDLLIILDAGGYERLGPLGAKLKALNRPLICIDHHPNGGHDALAKVIDEKVAATVSLIYDLIRHFDPGLMDIRIAEALYVGLLTDTGSFRFDNTDPATFRLAAELIEYGLKPNEIYSQIYENYRPERMRLLGKVLEKVHYELGNRLAWFTVTREQIQAAGAVPDEVDGFTEFVRSIKGVEIAIMFLEVHSKRTRLNFRSRGRFNVNGVAHTLGGGGHPHAAGVVLDLGLEEAINTVLPPVRELLQVKESK
jgi:phosphoesterase RecJ-like protein